MKKILLTLGALLAGAQLYAATPLEQAGQVNQGPYSNTTIIGSSAPASGSAGTIIFPVVTKTSGGQTIQCRNCLTRVMMQLSVGTTFYLLDGGTTDYVVYGIGLGASGTNTHILSENSIEPLCGTYNNSMTLSIPAPGTATANNVINAEGYTFCGYANNSGL